MKRFYSMNYSHNKSSYSMNNTDHSKARSTGTHEYENLGDSIDSYLQKRSDPALSLPKSSSNVSNNSSPKKKVSHLNPSKLKLYQKAEPVVDNPESGETRAGVLYDRHSDVTKRSSDHICNYKRAACYDHRSSYCRDQGEKVGAVSRDMLKVQVEEGGVECSMCGDVGIAELLFLCSKCSLRPQHTYCGRSYPNVCGEASVCNWCLYEQDSSTLSSAVEELQNPAPTCINEESYTDEALVETVGPHGKAFDYLLLVAAQSELPQSSDGIKQTNQTASKINITDSKIIMTSSYKKARMGLTESNGSVISEARMGNDRERSVTGLVKKLNMEIIQSAVNIKVEETRNRGGAVLAAGENTPKRQRCSKGLNESVLKCRKRGLQLSPARSNYRRYKLLADVVC